jgi:hypothetical protein
LHLMFKLSVTEQQITKINNFNLINNSFPFSYNYDKRIETTQMKSKNDLNKQRHMNASVCNWHVLSYCFTQQIKKQNVFKVSSSRRRVYPLCETPVCCHTTCKTLKINRISFRWQDSRGQTDKLK